MRSGSRQVRSDIALHGLAQLAQSHHPAQEALEEILRRIAQVIDFDGVFAGATDPDTGLCLGAGLVCDIDERVCHPIWEHEFRVPDVNKFADLTAERPVGDLRESTRGRMDASPRYRMMTDTVGLGEELRATFRAGGRPWGIVQLNRWAGAEPFGEQDRVFLRRAAPLAGAALRRSLLGTSPRDLDGHDTGIVVLDEVGAVVSATAAAEHWLRELLTAWPGQALADVPPAMVLGALSTLGPNSERGWRVRVRTAAGVWLVAHAAPLRETRQVAMVIEPATASEIAPVMMRAHALTQREIEVTRAVARGLSTAEIASAISVSSHTVRDHLKAVFEKVGVGSRGELTSRLFAEHYHDHYDRALGASFARIPALIASARDGS